MTNAAGEQGGAICRALLSSNALVLGVDSTTPHKSTKFVRGGHFQFLKLGDEKVREEKDEGIQMIENAETVEEALQKHFPQKPVDFLVLVEEEGKELQVEEMKEVLDGMAKRRNGCVLYVGEKEEMTSVARVAADKYKASGVRWNVLLPFSTSFLLFSPLKILSQSRESGGQLMCGRYSFIYLPPLYFRCRRERRVTKAHLCF